MEILLLIAFIAVISVVIVIRTRLSDNLKMIISIISGTILVIWFWVIMDGLIYWKIIVAVVVIGSLFTLFRAMRKNRKN